MITSTNTPPYPRIAECYRTLAVALDTKASNRDVDRLAREGDYDWSLLSNLNDELIVAPLLKYVEKDFADFVGQWLEQMRRSYKALVSSVALDSLSRADALPLLISNYFAPQANGLILGIHERFGGPEVAELMDPARNPIAVVWEWLNQNEGKSLEKVAFPGTTGTDRSDREKVLKWVRGIELPKLTSIKKFADAIDKSGTVLEEKVLNLRRWLIVARALAYLEKESPYSPRSHMLQHIMLGSPVVDVQSILSLAVIFSAEKYSALTLPALRLYDDLKRLAPKQPGDQERIKRAIDELECLTAEHDPEANTSFHLHWMKARWYTMAGQLEHALCHYENAIESGSYRAGAMLKSILEESFALAAFLGKKSSLNRLKHRAVALELLADPRDELIEDWEIAQFSQQFHRLFPSHGRFQEAAPLEGENPHFGSLLLGPEEIGAIRPDLESPNRVRTIRSSDGQVRRWPQLRFFASIGKTQEVAILLQQGASVDLLDEAGGSALLCAIQHAEQTGDRGVLDLLLQKEHSKTTLDSVTIKKRLTPLICAIDYGEPDVVEKILSMGAKADRRGNIIDETPLYHVMGTVASVNQPGKLYRYLHASLETNPDMMRQEVLRRHGAGFAGVFGDSRPFDAIGESESHKALFGKIIADMVKECVARHTIPKLNRIIELLLKSGANPNAKHTYPALGRTPLMLAAENNTVLAFDLMMGHRGDPYQTDAAGLSSLRIAVGFRSAQVVNYLRNRGIM